MTYTVWSRGRLIGQSDLAYRRAFPKLCMGDFYPSELGDKLMPIVVGAGPALLAFYDVAIAAKEAGQEIQTGADDWSKELRQSTEYADATSIQDELDSLALELRDEHGKVVKIDWLRIQDTHRLIELARRVQEESHFDPAQDAGDEELLASIDEMQLDDMKLGEVELEQPNLEETKLEFDDDPESWEEPEFPRYQIMVAPAGHDRYME